MVLLSVSQLILQARIVIYGYIPISRLGHHAPKCIVIHWQRTKVGDGAAMVSIPPSHLSHASKREALMQDNSLALIENGLISELSPP